jgi:hypothetical protein
LEVGVVVAPEAGVKDRPNVGGAITMGALVSLAEEEVWMAHLMDELGVVVGPRMEEVVQVVAAEYVSGEEASEAVAEVMVHLLQQG